MKRNDFDVIVEKSSFELYFEFIQKQNFIDDNNKKTLQQLKKNQTKTKFFRERLICKIRKIS